MPAIDDLSKHLAAGVGIAAHGLIRLASGELAYVTRRFDRQTVKVAIEDFCPLRGLLGIGGEA